jgi:hypothetical protein
MTKKKNDDKPAKSEPQKAAAGVPSVLDDEEVAYSTRTMRRIFNDEWGTFSDEKLGLNGMEANTALTRRVLEVLAPKQDEANSPPSEGARERDDVTPDAPSTKGDAK